MSDPVRVPPSGGPGHWRRWLLPVLASAAWLVLTFCLYRHAVQGEQAHLLELCHTRLAATAHQLMDARDWNAGHGGVYVPLSAYGEPNPWLPEKDRTLQTADGRMGLIDKTGRYVLEPHYEIVEYDDRTGRLLARLDGRWAAFDYEGRQLTEFGAVEP